MNHAIVSKSTAAVLLTTLVVGFSLTSLADENAALKEELKLLRAKVTALEEQLAYKDRPSLAYHYADEWDPFAQMRLMEHQMKRLISSSMPDINPREDIKQMEDAYIISMDIPGMDKDKIDVELKNGMLIISGERKSESTEDKPNKYHRQERFFGHFYRAMALPKDAKADAVEAKYENGVLTVKIGRNKAAAQTESMQKIKVK